ncbi:MAG: hypothetical protein AB7T63_17165 [Planctomycetota bacterium]
MAPRPPGAAAWVAALVAAGCALLAYGAVVLLGDGSGGLASDASNLAGAADPEEAASPPGAGLHAHRAASPEARSAPASPAMPAPPPPERIIERVPPIGSAVEPELATLDNEALQAIGATGDPTIGIPRRVEALETLLKRALTTEERSEALSRLASNLRALQVPTQTRQVDVLEDLIKTAGPESELGQRGVTQLCWPLMELGRKEEALRRVTDLANASYATPRYRGLALWGAILCSIDLGRLEQAEAHFARLRDIQEPLLASTIDGARQRIAAARAKRAREAEAR